MTALFVSGRKSVLVVLKRMDGPSRLLVFLVALLGPTATSCVSTRRTICPAAAVPNESLWKNVMDRGSGIENRRSAMLPRPFLSPLPGADTFESLCLLDFSWPLGYWYRMRFCFPIVILSLLLFQPAVAWVGPTPVPTPQESLIDSAVGPVFTSEPIPDPPTFLYGPCDEGDIPESANCDCGLYGPNHVEAHCAPDECVHCWDEHAAGWCKQHSDCKKRNRILNTQPDCVGDACGSPNPPKPKWDPLYRGYWIRNSDTSRMIEVVISNDSNDLWLRIAPATWDFADLFGYGKPIQANFLAVVPTSPGSVPPAPAPSLLEDATSTFFHNECKLRPDVVVFEPVFAQDGTATLTCIDGRTGRKATVSLPSATDAGFGTLSQAFFCAKSAQAACEQAGVVACRGAVPDQSTLLMEPNREWQIFTKGGCWMRKGGEVKATHFLESTP